METAVPEVVMSGDITEILEDSINPVRTVTIDEDITDEDTGELLVPAGDYKVSSFTVDKEIVRRLLGNMTLNGAPIPNAEMLLDENADAQLVGAIYEGLDDPGAGLGYMFITASDDETMGYNGLYYILSTDEDGKTLAFDILGGTGESKMEVQFALNEHTVEHTTFGPDAVDMDNIINVSELVAAGEENPLLPDLQVLLGDAIAAALAPMAAQFPMDEFSVDEFSMEKFSMDDFPMEEVPAE